MCESKKLAFIYPYIHMTHSTAISSSIVLVKIVNAIVLIMYDKGFQMLMFGERI